MSAATRLQTSISGERATVRTARSGLFDICEPRPFRDVRGRGNRALADPRTCKALSGERRAHPDWADELIDSDCGQVVSAAGGIAGGASRGGQTGLTLRTSSTKSRRRVQGSGSGSPILAAGAWSRSSRTSANVLICSYMRLRSSFSMYPVGAAAQR